MQYNHCLLMLLQFSSCFVAVNFLQLRFNKVSDVVVGNMFEMRQQVSEK